MPESLADVPNPINTGGSVENKEGGPLGGRPQDVEAVGCPLCGGAARRKRAPSGQISRGFMSADGRLLKYGMVCEKCGKDSQAVLQKNESGVFVLAAVRSGGKQALSRKGSQESSASEVRERSR